MIYRKGQRVLVQGITGKQGSFWTEKMAGCGTIITGGVNPKRAGETYLGLPVFASAKAAMADAPFDVAVMFIPPAAAKAAALDAIEAGAQTLVVLTEHIPAQDVLASREAGKAAGTIIVGPNTAGIVTPGVGFVGIMPGHNPNIFQPGRVGVISRSGSLGTLICLNLTRMGLGQSAFIGIGGDPMIGRWTPIPAPTPSCSWARSVAAWKRRPPNMLRACESLWSRSSRGGSRRRVKKWAMRGPSLQPRRAAMRVNARPWKRQASGWLIHPRKLPLWLHPS
jgi:hypothetical protein